MKTLQTTLLFMLLGLMMTGANAQISSNLALEYNTNGVISAARYVAGNYGDTSQEATFLQQLLTNDSSHHFLLVSSKIDALGWTHRKYQQYYKGIRVYGGEYLTHSLGGRVKNVSGHFMPVLLANPNAQITDTAAINIGLSNIGAFEYAWQDSSIEAYLRVIRKDSNATYYPKPELVIAPKELTATSDKLVWVFKVAATDPTDELLVMVDAITGVLVKKKSIACNSNFQDTAYTKYSGTLPILTSFRKSGGGHILKEFRALGTSGDSVEIHTYDNKGNSYYNLSNATEIVNIDTISTTNTKIWTTPNWAGFSKDQQALDAHAANEKIIDYWYQVHQRKSYDDSLGAVNGYIHIGEKIGQQFNNAAWLGTRGDMAYGDGNGTKTRPWVALDVCAHEIGHGVCQYTAKLNLAFSEAGGLNEGFSDIWAVCIEKWANWGGNKKNWLFGEEVTILDSCIRNLKEPKKDKTPSPDCYNSPLWLKTVGQHYLAGVLRRWFYLLTEGGNGVNDLNNTYAVRGVGIDTAAAIAYRLECNLVSSSGYHDARTVSINQAKNLYGDSSYVIDAIKNAWYAVGVDSVVAIPQCLTTKPTVITSIGSDTVFNGGVYFIPNSLGIDWSVTFNNATVYVGERAALYLLNGSKLAVNGSRFTTCQGQWRGILVDLNAEVSIDGSLTSGRSSLIENADTAIALDHQMSNYSSNGNIIAVNNTIFNRNKIGISIANYTSDTLITYPFLIKNTLFTSRKIAEDSSTVWPNVATVKNSGSASAAYPATPLSYDAPYINSSTYPNAFLKDTSNGTTKYPTVGILLNKVAGYDSLGNRGGVVIGSGSDSTILFDNLVTGIRATQTNLVLRNCTFQNAASTGSAGVDIHNEVHTTTTITDPFDGATSSLTQHLNDYYVDISTDETTPNNAFFNMPYAILVNGGAKTTIANCDIRSTQSIQDMATSVSTAGSFGILFSSNYYDSLIIANNNIYNVRNAITVSNSLERPMSGLVTNYGAIAVNHNLIANQLPGATPTNNEYVENAITFSAMQMAGNTNGSASAALDCKGNKITNVLNGIKASWWIGKNTHIDNDTIQLTVNTNDASYVGYGISLEGGVGDGTASYSNTVTGNLVTGYGMNANTRGIYLSQQANTEVGCNVVAQCQDGFRFVGSNPQTKFWDNTMRADNQFGMTLDNGFIGQQGVDDGTNVCPSNNNWEYAPDGIHWDSVSNGQFMTFCKNSEAKQSPFVILVNPSHPELNPNSSAKTTINLLGYKFTIYDTALFLVNAQKGTCSRCAGADTSYFRGSITDGVLDEIAQGTIELPDDEAALRLKVMQEQLYEVLQVSPDLRNANTNFQEFIADNQHGSIDYIHLIAAYITQGRMDLVEQLLNNWSHTNDDRVDEYYRVYYTWVLQMYQDVHWQPNLNEVLNYANSCPVKNGVIVYAFRNLYNALNGSINRFDDNCEAIPDIQNNQERAAQRIRPFIRLNKPKNNQVQPINNFSNNSIKIYPNPASNYIKIECTGFKSIQVTDIMGKCVITKKVSGNGYENLDVSKLPNGIFTLKLQANKGDNHISKLVIAH